MTDSKLRVWPGIAAGSLIVIGFLIALIPADNAAFGLVGALVGALAIAVWWLFFSKAPWSERLGVLALLAIAWFATRPFLHISILGGAMGGLPILAFPLLFAALGIAVWATRNLSDGIRRVSIVGAILVACGFCTLIRTAGIGGPKASIFEFHWRWTPTPEDLLLAKGDEEPARIPPVPAAPAVEAKADSPASAAAVAAKPADWPGFRGSDRNSIIHNVRIETDWSKAPPVQLWRRPIGPGWSSFAVDGDLLYTQEQRGEEEVVAAYQLSTGKPVWRHRDAVRFYESNGGPGPRGTPTLRNGRVYTFGGTGVLNALDAATGAVIWSRNAAADAKVEVPTWGFSSSPLVTDDLVVIAVEGKLAAFDITTGKPRWFGPGGGFSYRSPQLLAIDGVPQVVMLAGAGAVSLAPSDGAVLWQKDLGGGAIVQPAITDDGDILASSIAPTGGQGLKRLAISHKTGSWTVDERWTSTGLKPYFNDFVVHNGHAYGFDGSILSSIDLTDGKRTWKGGRYGEGQLVLLADQDVLLVLSDEGELALVSATPDAFKEIARFKAIEGKTWNHPVLVRDILLVRNGEEMAAFRLTTTP
jgi:outer membrane protein assembly factor BamB